jgi:hypothetical protein
LAQLTSSSPRPGSSIPSGGLLGALAQLANLTSAAVGVHAFPPPLRVGANWAYSDLSGSQSPLQDLSSLDRPALQAAPGGDWIDPSTGAETAVSNRPGNDSLNRGDMPRSPADATSGSRADGGSPRARSASVGVLAAPALDALEMAGLGSAALTAGGVAAVVGTLLWPSPIGPEPVILPNEQSNGDGGSNSPLPAGIGTGPFSGDPVPAGPSESPSPEQQGQINAGGAKNGCHTCGAKTPGTASGNWVGDHQLPTALNPLGKRQVYLPHCLSCSRRQGGLVRSFKQRAK